MSVLQISLFHRLRIHTNIGVVSVEGLKVQELLCYLVLFRHKAHPRELLAEQFWSKAPSSHSRRYLRKTLWQLQQAFNGLDGGAKALVQSESEWVQIDPIADLEIDTAMIEDAYAMVRGVPGDALTAAQAVQMQAAVAVYAGDLLEGWYQDWCLQERQRYQFMYLALLDKLIGYCTATREYEAGIEYCMQLLSYDPTREHTHRQLMWLYHLAGHRAAALNQFNRCADALQRELDVVPDVRTVDLCQRIKAGMRTTSVTPQAHDTDLAAALARLEQAQVQLNKLQQQIAADICLLRQCVYANEG